MHDHVHLAIDGGPGSFTTLNPCTTTGGTGSCQITLTSATTGTTVARAHVTLSVGGLAVSRNTNGTGANSGAARKTWVDTTPPVLNVPGDFAVDATSPGGAVVKYTVWATDAVDPAPVVACVPASGTRFPIGDTTVACTATDSAGNSSSAGFVVHVRGADEQLVMLEAVVEGAGLGKNCLTKLEQARTALPDNTAAARFLNTFINDVKAQQGKKIPVDVATELIGSATRIRAVLAW